MRTRLYNQPATGERWYSGGGDVARQLLRSEGTLAFYKGALTHYLRLGPHMVLVFGFLEQFKLLLSKDPDALAKLESISLSVKAKHFDANQPGSKVSFSQTLVQQTVAAGGCCCFCCCRRCRCCCCCCRCG